MASKTPRAPICNVGPRQGRIWAFHELLELPRAVRLQSKDVLRCATAEEKPDASREIEFPGDTRNLARIVLPHSKMLLRSHQVRIVIAQRYDSRFLSED
jgi:hypothetical protein